MRPLVFSFELLRCTSHSMATCSCGPTLPYGFPLVTLLDVMSRRANTSNAALLHGNHNGFKVLNRAGAKMFCQPDNGTKYLFNT